MKKVVYIGPNIRGATLKMPDGVRVQALPGQPVEVDERIFDSIVELSTFASAEEEPVKVVEVVSEPETLEEAEYAEEEYDDEE